MPAPRYIEQVARHRIGSDWSGSSCSEDGPDPFIWTGSDMSLPVKLSWWRKRQLRKNPVLQLRDFGLRELEDDSLWNP